MKSWKQDGIYLWKLSLSLSFSGHQMEFTNSQHDHFCASQHDAYPALAACSPEMAGFLSTPCLNKTQILAGKLNRLLFLYNTRVYTTMYVCV